MRYFYTVLLLVVSNLCVSQVQTTTTSEDSENGKDEFKRQTTKDTADYSKAVSILSKQVSQDPRNAEHRYFLGYALDRLNANDGKDMFQLQKQLTIKASEQFEEVNRLQPVYTGELFLLDPYAKLTSIWGSLAQSYLNKKLPDSALWAFSEGKRRGGFLEPVLEFNRQLLNSCEKGAILVTYGDNITVPIWYLQALENFRPDITVVDANLINTAWYPKYLKSERNLKMGFSDAVIDTIDYELWESQIITIQNPADTTQRLSWELRPTYMDSYILKADKILLDIFRNNLFSRPIYFTNNSDSSYNLFLSHQLVDEGLVNRLIPKAIDWNSNVLTIHQNIYQYNINGLEATEIIKSPDAVKLLNGFRWSFYINIYNLLQQSSYEKANQLIKLMNERFKKEKLPFTSIEAEEYFLELFKEAGK